MEPTHFESLYPENARFSEIEKILSYVKEGNSCQLIGLPGVGRGTVLGFLAYNSSIRQSHLGGNQKWFQFVFTNFSEMRNRDLFTVTKFLFLTLIDSLRERGLQDEYAQANQIFKETLALRDELVLFQGLKRTIDFLAIQKELTIVFLFDRFEEYIPSVNADFFSNLRVLRNRAKYRFSVIFSLNKPLEDLIEPSLFAEFHEFLAGHTVYMAIEDLPGLTFHTNYLAKITGKKISEDLRKKVFRLTAGHGKLTRLAIEACLAENIETEEKKLSTFLLAQRPVRGGLKEIWRSFSPVEQLWILNKNRIPENETIRKYLENIHFIAHDTVTIPLVIDFLTEEEYTLITQHEKIEFDTASNGIRKGKLMLSDDLTSAEFRLLSYFLQQCEQVIDRNTIIDVVWGENKSIAGVTEQALDQLILRLRKKIEESPSQPRHIQTVKGRGFKFIP